MKPFISPRHCHSLCRFQPRTQFDLFLLYSFRDSVTLVAEIVINIITWREKRENGKGSLFKISFRVHRVNYRLTKSIKFILWPSSPVIKKKVEGRWFGCHLLVSHEPAFSKVLRKKKRLLTWILKIIGVIFKILFGAFHRRCI